MWVQVPLHVVISIVIFQANLLVYHVASIDYHNHQFVGSDYKAPERI